MSGACTNKRLERKQRPLSRLPNSGISTFAVPLGRRGVFAYGKGKARGGPSHGHGHQRAMHMLLQATPESRPEGAAHDQGLRWYRARAGGTSQAPALLVAWQRARAMQLLLYARFVH